MKEVKRYYRPQYGDLQIPQFTIVYNHKKHVFFLTKGFAMTGMLKTNEWNLDPLKCHHAYKLQWCRAGRKAKLLHAMSAEPCFMLEYWGKDLSWKRAKEIAFQSIRRFQV